MVTKDQQVYNVKWAARGYYRLMKHICRKWLWFRSWPGAVRHKVTTWTDADTQNMTWHLFLLVSLCLVYSGEDSLVTYHVFFAGKSLFYGGTLAGPLWNMLPYEQSIVLHVKGTGKAKVTLAAVPGVTSQDTYEITLENRDLGCLLNFNGETQDLFSFEDTNTLSSSRYFTFWMSWKQGMIEVGSGSTVGLGRFLGWRNLTPVPIRALTVNKDVFWRFDSESGRYYKEVSCDYESYVSSILFGL